MRKFCEFTKNFEKTYFIIVANQFKKIEFVETLKDFRKNNNKFHRTTDKEMKGIKKAIYRGEWSKFGVKGWTDFHF